MCMVFCDLNELLISLGDDAMYKYTYEKWVVLELNKMNYKALMMLINI